MNIGWRIRCAIGALAVGGVASQTQGYVQSVDNVGHALRWASMPVGYKKNVRGAPDAAGEFAAIDAAFATWNSVANSAISITNQGPTSAGANVSDGQNTVVWIEDPSLTANGSTNPVFVSRDLIALTRTRSDGAGNMLEADIMLNGIFWSWSATGTDCFSGESGPVDIQSIVTHEVGHFLGLDHVTNVNSIMFGGGSYPGNTTWRSLSQDEISAAQAIYPSGGAPPDSSISGQVTRSGSVGVARPLVLAFQNGAPVVGAMADASGNYRIHRLPAGSFTVRLQPYTRATSFGQSGFYQNSANVDVDFLSQIYSGVAQESTASSVTVTAGADTPNINFTASATGNMDDPFEQDDTFAMAKSIGVTGQAHLKHAWPASESDWVTFNATAGRIYIIDTKNLGIGRDDTVLDSATIIELYDQTGTNMIASNGSPNNLETNNGSRIARLESVTATRYVRIYQRTPATAGAGTFYDVTVNELAGPFSAPVVTSLNAPQASVDGGVVVAVHGSNFIAGASVTFDGLAGTETDVQDCLTPRNCQTIKVRVPAHAAGTVTVQATNLDGSSGSLPNGFTYVADAVGTFADGTFTAFGDYLGNGTVACWGDYDGDGDPDLYSPFTHFNGAGPGELLRNNGDGTFTDVTAAAGLDTSGTAFRASCAWGDYDNDGKLDLYVVYGGIGAANRLYHNNGDGTFTEVAAIAQVTGNTSYGKTDAAWADYDGDGYLDLYLTYGQPGTMPFPANQLFRNNHDGTFTDMAASAKVDLTGQSSRALWADYDNDGRPDLYVLKRSGQGDVLFHNDGNGVFSNVTAAAGIVEGPNCFDAVWADFNNDHYLDLLCVGDSLPGSQPQRFWINQGNGTFKDQAAGSGINNLGRHATAVTVLDKDNDGDFDVYLGCSAFTGFPDAILDALLANNGANPPVFTNVSIPPGSTPSGIDESSYPTNSNAVAAADFDGDGYTDVCTVGQGDASSADDYLWRGTSNTNQSVTVKLNGTISNSWGIGAEVVVISDLPGTDSPSEANCLSANGTSPAHRQEVIGGSLNQSSMELEFGLGSRPVDTRQVDCVNVYWPRSGLRRAYTQVATMNYVTFTETAPDLRVTKVAPPFGTTAGGTQVTVTGFNFDPSAAQVFFGGVAAAIVSRQGTNFITVNTPANPAGATDVKVQNPGGASGTLTAGYSYVAPSTKITLTVNKDATDNAVALSWTSIGQDRYRVHRATGPKPADFSAGFQTVVPRTTYQDTNALNDGVSYYYLIDEGGI